MLDHLLVAVFAVGNPLVNIPLYARRRARLALGDHLLKRREYAETVLWLAGMGIATLGVWLVAQRDPAALGLGWPVTWRFGAGLAAAGGVALLLWIQVLAVRRDPRTAAVVANALQPVREFLPASASEWRWFRAVSFLAGIGEELFYRGFLLWYLGQVMPLLPAVALSSLVFGLAHVMHGRQATVRATLMGMVLAGLYVFSGALWAPMLLHAAVDLSSGAMGLHTAGAAETEQP